MDRDSTVSIFIQSQLFWFGSYSVVCYGSLINKSFIFDLDGVLIDEHMREDKKRVLHKELFGDEIGAKIGSTLGINTDGANCTYSYNLKSGYTID